MGSFLIRADIATIDQLDAHVTAKEATLVEAMPDADQDTRRVHAVLLMANPGATPDTDIRELLPTVQLYLHVYPGPDSEGIARLEGHGPVTEAWITRVLGPRAKFKITPVLDLEGQAPVDAYEIPDRHRQAVHLMTPADTFPYASSLSRQKQVDHTVPHDQGGEYRRGQLRADDHPPPPHQDPRRLRRTQPFPGIYIWRDPHGGYTLVDHTGTRRLPGTTTRVVEIYRDLPRLELDDPTR